MLTPADYADRDGLGLAELIKAGEVTAAEVQETAVAAITAVDEDLNAVVEGPFEPALRYAEDSTFAGVPFVLKDILCHAEGVPMHLGCRGMTEGIVFDHDSHLMSRFRAAGMATVATARTPELAMSAWTEPLLGGAVHSPWNLAKSPGGSSGGPAALVASGAVPLAHANDGGGSIRIPASYNGLVGLKPSRGRVPIGPGYQEVMFGNAVEFALTRTVRDCAALFDAVHGNMPGERGGAPLPARPYSQEITGRGRPLRIGVCTDAWSGVDVDPEVRQVVEQTASTLRDLGHHVEEARPDIVWDEMLGAFTTTWCAGLAMSVYGLAELLGLEVDGENFEGTTLTCARAGSTMTPLDLGAAFNVMNTVTRSFAAFTSEWDVFLTPTSNTLPPDLGTFDADNLEDSPADWVRRVISPFPLCMLYNISGSPAMSVPVGQSADGLPIGVQIGTAMFDESVLFQLAAQLEESMPWADRRPAVHVSKDLRPA
jgi:amidase